MSQPPTPPARARPRHLAPGARAARHAVARLDRARTAEGVVVPEALDHRGARLRPARRRRLLHLHAAAPTAAPATTRAASSRWCRSSASSSPRCCSAAGGRPRPGCAFTAIITMADEGDGTRYTATVMHPDKATRDRHEEMGFFDGWNTCIDQLEAFAQRAALSRQNTAWSPRSGGGVAAQQRGVVVEQRLACRSTAWRRRRSGRSRGRAPASTRSRSSGRCAPARPWRASAGTTRPGRAQHADDGVEQRHRHLPEARRAAEQREQQLALLARRDRLARPADRQHAVAARPGRRGSRRGSRPDRRR